MASTRCSTHNCELTGFGSLAFCPKCEVEPPTPSKDVGMFYVGYLHPHKEELVLDGGTILFAKYMVARDYLQNMLRIGPRSLYAVPEQVLVGRMTRDMAEPDLWELDDMLIGVPATYLEEVA